MCEQHRAAIDTHTRHERVSHSHGLLNELHRIVSFFSFTNDDVVDRLIFEESILDSLRKTAKNFPQRGRVSNPTGNFDGKRNEKIKRCVI